jgi:hypothetical protein
MIARLGCQVPERDSRFDVRGFSLAAVDVRPSRLSGTRKIADVIFAFSNRNKDVAEKHFVRVDMTKNFVAS